MTKRIWRISSLSFHFLEGILVAGKHIGAAAASVEQTSHIDVLGDIELIEVLLGKLCLQAVVSRGFRV